MFRCILTLYLCLKRQYPKTIYKDLRDVIVREYLRKDPRLEEFEEECFNRFPHLVKRYAWLVKQRLINVSYIGLASGYGYIEVVRLLLNDKRLNPAANNNKAIIEASISGHTEVVRLLLNYRNLDHPEREVNPAALDNEAIRRASGAGHVEVVQLLLNDDRVDPAAARNYAIHGASLHGHAGVVQLLLNYRNLNHPEREVNPAAWDNEAIQMASHNGHVEVVRLLLEDPRVRRSVDMDSLIEVAKKKRKLKKIGI